MVVTSAKRRSVSCFVLNFLLSQKQLASPRITKGLVLGGGGGARAKTLNEPRLRFSLSLLSPVLTDTALNPLKRNYVRERESRDAPFHR